LPWLGHPFAIEKIEDFLPLYHGILQIWYLRFFQ
jgi:hypothetical protein